MPNTAANMMVTEARYIGKSGNGLLSDAIVGTLSKIPAIFAHQFSLEFFKRFFEGQMIGSVMRDLRIKFMTDHNLLGLFYTSYCYSKLRLHPPLFSSTNHQ